MSHNIVHNGSLGVQEVHEIICTVDDIAEGGGEMAALATLMYASSPIQQCLSSGSVKRHRSSSAQCTFENLRHGLQQFPTLWRAFVTASIELDGNSSSLGLNAKRGTSLNNFQFPLPFPIFSFVSDFFFFFGKIVSDVKTI